MKFKPTLTKWLLGAALLFGVLGVPRAHANPDSMTISVTPLVTYGVTISSVSINGYNFGNVALGATTQSTAAIVITNSGNASEYFSMAVSNTSGNWAAVSGVPGQDEFRLMAQLASSQPAVGSFTDALTNLPVPGAAAALYGQSGRTAPTDSANLWLRLEMPTTLNIGTAAAQTMTLIVNGQGS